MSSSTTQVIAARLPNEQASQLRSVANNCGLTVNDVVRVALDQALPAPEQYDATQLDAQQRVAQLKRVLRRLWPDRDDTMVVCEIHDVLAELRKAEAEINRINREYQR